MNPTRLIAWLFLSFGLISISCENNPPTPANKPTTTPTTLTTPTTPANPTPPTNPAKKRYTVTFDTRGGSAVAPKTVEEGQLVGQPDDPTMLRHRFLAWYKDPMLTRTFSFATETIMADITLYATWEELVFTVNYDLNGGQGSLPAVQTYNESPLTLDEAKSLTKGELYFIGWSTKKDDEASKVASPYTPTGNVTLYALWTDNIFAFDAQKGAITGIDSKYADRYAKKTLTRVKIPATIQGVSVTAIGKGAFEFCNVLERVTIPNGITEIGEDAFFNCRALERITIPNSVTTIGLSVLSGCRTLTSVTLPDKLVDIPPLMFYACSSLTSITLPKSLERVGLSAFKGCTVLKNLAIPNGVKSIEDEAFSGCANLTITFSGITPP